MAGDGEMMEMVNARISAAGTVEPVGVPELVKETVNTYKEIYHHSIVDRYIGITQEGYLYEIAEDFSSESLIYSSTPVTKLNFIGKTVSALTEEGIIYFLYKNGYKYLGPLPELPEIEIGKKYSFVKGVRGMGLMIGVVLDREAATLAGLCLKQNLVVLTAGETVLRLLPRLNLTRAEADEGIARISAALEELNTLIQKG